MALLLFFKECYMDWNSPSPIPFLFGTYYTWKVVVFITIAVICKVTLFGVLSLYKKDSPGKPLIAKVAVVASIALYLIFLAIGGKAFILASIIAVIVIAVAVACMAVFHYMFSKLIMDLITWLRT